MKTLLKRATCLALCACLLLTGCAKSSGDASSKEDAADGQNKNVAMGRYIEQIIDLPAGDLPPRIFVQEDGSLLLYNLINGNVVSFTSADGKKWNEASAGVLSTLAQSEKGLGELVSVSPLKNGETYVLYRDKAYAAHLSFSSDGKTLQEIPIKGWDQGPVGPKIKSGQDENAAFEQGTSPASVDGQGNTETPGNTGGPKVINGQETTVSQEEGTGGPQTSGKNANGQKIADGMFNGMKAYPQSLTVLENGDSLIGYFDNVVRYGKDGTEKMSYNGLGNSFAVSSDKLMMFNKEHNAISIFNINSGEVTGTVPYSSANAMMSGMSVSIGGGAGSTIAADETGALYIADEKGIHRLAPGGELWETVVDGELNSMSLPSANISSLLLDAKGGFYVAMHNQKAVSLSHYTYSADTPSVPVNELSVYALENNETVRQAIGEFQRANPDVKVTFRYGKSEDSAASVSDLIRTLNTELLAGKGPDLLLLDSLPVDSYIEKGVLMDMSAALKPLLDSGAILSNIANCYVVDGKIFSMPTRFSFPAMFGSKNALDSAKTLKSLADAVEQSGDANFTMANTRKGRIAQFLLTSAPAWINESGAINQAVLADYLSDIKRIGDVSGDDTFVQEGPPLALGAIDDTDELGALNGGMDSIMKYYAGELKLHMQMLHGFNDLMFPFAANDKIENSTVAPLSGQSSNVFVPHGIVGINNASKQKELAVQFVQSLFGESVQDTDLNDGFSVNASSLEKNIKKEKNTMLALVSKEGGEPISASWPSEENLHKVIDLMKTLTTPSTVDTVLLEMIQNECDAFFAGEKTAEQTAAAIAERTQAYLAE